MCVSKYAESCCTTATVLNMLTGVRDHSRTLYINGQSHRMYNYFCNLEVLTLSLSTFGELEG